jgi:hypothetical protein
MRVDDYYFTKDGNLLHKEIKKEPDRFFIEEDDGPTEFNGYNFSEIDLNSDLGKLGRIIYAEGGGEPNQIQRAIGEVVSNRVNSKRFPNSYSEVIEQKSQFTATQSNRPESWRYHNPRSTSNKIEKTAFANSMANAIKIFYNGSNILDRADHYYSPISMRPPYSEPKWIKGMTETTPNYINKKSFRSFK